MIFLVDADILCYRIGFACQSESEGVACKTMGNFLEDIIHDLLLEVDDDSIEVELYLTGKDNFRFDYAVTAEYKGNRKKNSKPEHLQALRDYLVSDYGAIVTEGEETDDRIAIRATEEGDGAVIISLDKDFDQVKGWHYNFVKKDLYYVQEDEGLLNFYKQFLMGDSADNIIGVRGLGDKKSHKLLEGKSEQEMFDICVEKLESRERAIENGILLYLRRTDNEIWTPPDEREAKE